MRLTAIALSSISASSVRGTMPNITFTVDEGPILRKGFRQLSYCQLLAIRSHAAGSFHLQWNVDALSI